MDKTYAETQGAIQIDWPKMLQLGIDGRLSDRERVKMGNLAACWPTCACGNQCAIIRRHETGQPIDRQLSELGGKFYVEVDTGLWYAALETWRKIEERAAILVKLELAKLNAK